MPFDLATTPLQGLVLGLVALPVCLWVVRTDVVSMRIPNVAVLALFGGFVAAAPFTMGWGEYGWRLVHAAVVLAIGFVLSASPVRLGAGDAKFAAAMAPYVATADLGAVIWLYVVATFAGLAVHRAAKLTPPIRRATAGWASWSDSKVFPFGIVLATVLMAYLMLAAAGGQPVR